MNRTNLLIDIGIFAVFLVAVALRGKRPRVVVFLNYWFVLVVAWNLCTIFSQALSRR